MVAMESRGKRRKEWNAAMDSIVEKLNDYGNNAVLSPWFILFGRNR